MSTATPLGVLLERLGVDVEAPALILPASANRPERICTYGDLQNEITYWRGELTDAGVVDGAVVELAADFTPRGLALLLALLSMRCIVAPLTARQTASRNEFLDIAQVEWTVQVLEEQVTWTRHKLRHADHELYKTLRERRSPGLVLFSSGSTGKSKATVHDFDRLCEKFVKPHMSPRTLAFLLFDHIGGLDVALYVLSGHGCLVAPAERTPESAAQAIDNYQVTLFPTSPTFLNMLILSGALERYDFSSLTTITYGTEPMPDSLLARCAASFPHAKLVQTYGLSELGAMRTESRGSDSPWIKLKGNEFNFRVVDGVLQIKSRSAMLGYLNAPSPFTDDGWFITGDAVEVDGEYLRILGRKSEIINVGGEKVYPAEVENVILELSNVAEVSVYGEANPITGQIVCARVTPHQAATEPADLKELPRQIKAHCRDRLEAYKRPVKIVLTDDAQHGDRFKKMRPRE